MQEKLSGEIRSDCAYTVREFCRRTGLGFQRVHKHFKARRMAGRRFILGKDFIEALSREDELGESPFLRTVAEVLEPAR